MDAGTCRGAPASMRSGSAASTRTRFSRNTPVPPRGRRCCSIRWDSETLVLSADYRARADRTLQRVRQCDERGRGHAQGSRLHRQRGIAISSRCGSRSWRRRSKTAPPNSTGRRRASATNVASGSGTSRGSIFSQRRWRHRGKSRSCSRARDRSTRTCSPISVCTFPKCAACSTSWIARSSIIRAAICRAR